MFVPMDLTAFYTARPEYLRDALSLVPEYLGSREYSRTVNTQGRECKMAEAPKAVVEDHQDDALFGEFIS